MFDLISHNLNRLTIYRDILEDSIINEFKIIADSIADGASKPQQAVVSYHQLAFLLHQKGRSWQEHLIRLLLHDDNPFSREAEMGSGDNMTASLRLAAEQDLTILGRLFNLDFSIIAQQLGVHPDVLPWQICLQEDSPKTEHLLASSMDWSTLLEALADHYALNSRGLFSCYKAFRWNGKDLAGIKYPDTMRLDDLLGYQSQKKDISRNTENFLTGFPANNILLYGSRGTGKSSMIKALLNKYAGRRLRLVEVRRDQIKDLPEVISLLREYSLKFIVFIDDMSFEDYETEYKGLKAVIEGSLESQPANVLIYATSNRRHLVREFFSDRGKATDEIHTHDTMQEKLSLADRFGLTITFPGPDQKLYLEIVEKYAKERGLVIDPEYLRCRALEWERAHHGPSGRTARQFVDSLGGEFQS